MTSDPYVEPNYEAVRLYLSRLRAERGWNYDRLVIESGISRPVLLDLEAGRSRGSVTTWHRLAHVFNIEIGDILNHLCDDHQSPTGKR